MSYIVDPYNPLIPNQPYVGDFPPLPALRTPPGTEWRWNFFTRQWEVTRVQPLTTVGTVTTLPGVAKRETIEYTHDFDGAGSSSIKHVYWNENTERLTVQFVGRGTYSYDGVELYLFEDFESADSLGKFFSETFTPRGEEKWPGAKHDDRLVDFVKVEAQAEKYDEPEDDAPDVDALKPVALTGGKGPTFNLTFAYAARGTLPVRATDAHEAIKLFMDHMSAQGFTVTRVEATEA